MFIKLKEGREKSLLGVNNKFLPGPFYDYYVFMRDIYF